MSLENDEFLEERYQDYLNAGYSEEQAAKMAKEDLKNDEPVLMLYRPEKRVNDSHRRSVSG